MSRGWLAAKVAVLGEAKDPDEFVRERGAEALRSAVHAARNMLQHLIDASLDETFALGDPHQRAARAREVVELVASEDDPTVRAMANTYADQVAQRLNLADATSFRRVAVSRMNRSASANTSFGPMLRSTGSSAPSSSRESVRSRSDFGAEEARSRSDRST